MCARGRAWSPVQILAGIFRVSYALRCRRPLVDLHQSFGWSGALRGSRPIFGAPQCNDMNVILSNPPSVSRSTFYNSV